MDKKRGMSFSAIETLIGIGVVLLGTPLHYLYEAVGKAPIAGLLGPVNESAWEHLKLFYWPMLALSLIARRAAASKTTSYWLATLGAMIVAFAGMNVFYYLPRAIFGSSLFISIASFLMSVIVAVLCAILLARRQGNPGSERLCLLVIAALGLAFIAFTFFPPHLLPWLDMKAGGYGII
jgi:hypothetical protein